MSQKEKGEMTRGEMETGESRVSNSDRQSIGPGGRGAYNTSENQSSVDAGFATPIEHLLQHRPRARLNERCCSNVFSIVTGPYHCLTQW
ncbi:hypothetical protein ACOMHN_036874 [Nucella lapillus]